MVTHMEMKFVPTLCFPYVSLKHEFANSLTMSDRLLHWHYLLGTTLFSNVGHQSLTSGMQLRKNILVSGNADSNVKVCSKVSWIIQWS